MPTEDPRYRLTEPAFLELDGGPTQHYPAGHEFTWHHKPAHSFEPLNDSARRIYVDAGPWSSMLTRKFRLPEPFHTELREKELGRRSNKVR